MRLINVLTLSLLLIASVSNAQKLKLGPELGFNMIPMATNYLGTNFQPGFHAGVNVEYQFGDHFSVRSGVFASQKRQSFQSSDSALVNLFGLEDLIGIENVNLYSYTELDRTYSQFYVEMPLLATYHYKQFSFSAGPYFAYLLSSRRREIKTIDTPFLRVVDVEALAPDGVDVAVLLATLPPAEETTFTESSSKSQLRLFDMGFKAGIRYQMDDFGVNLNYQYGIFDYQTTSKDVLENHSYFQLTLNYNFGIGKK
jgi:hypothetical protein